MKHLCIYHRLDGISRLIKQVYIPQTRGYFSDHDLTSHVCILLMKLIQMN
jgi:hypothetical protein